MLAVGIGATRRLLRSPCCASADFWGNMLIAINHRYPWGRVPIPHTGLQHLTNTWQFASKNFYNLPLISLSRFYFPSTMESCGQGTILSFKACQSHRPLLGFRFLGLSFPAFEPQDGSKISRISKTDTMQSSQDAEFEAKRTPTPDLLI